MADHPHLPALAAQLLAQWRLGGGCLRHTSILPVMPAGSGRRRLLLRVWRDVPFPGWMRTLFLRMLNPSVMVGAMALIQDDQGRILVLEHTYRRRTPWGLPGGWLKGAETPEAGLVREVLEETGLH